MQKTTQKCIHYNWKKNLSSKRQVRHLPNNDELDNQKNKSQIQKDISLKEPLNDQKIEGEPGGRKDKTKKNHLKQPSKKSTLYNIENQSKGQQESTYEFRGGRIISLSKDWLNHPANKSKSWPEGITVCYDDIRYFLCGVNEMDLEDGSIVFIGNPIFVSLYEEYLQVQQLLYPYILYPSI